MSQSNERGDANVYDVVVIGGGPAGSAAAVFTGRYGLETLLLDRGRSSLQRIAHLENYLGFPAGIDTETFYGLAHGQVKQAGCDVATERVETVERIESGFQVRTDEGRVLETRRVLAASKYDHDYLENLGEDLFTTMVYEGDEYEVLDKEKFGNDGRTVIDGLYLAGATANAGSHTLVNAGHGATVGLTVIEDDRRERGFPEKLVDAYHDWCVIQDGYGGDEWEQELRDEFDESLPEDNTLTEAKIDTLRSEYVENHLRWEITTEEKERRRIEGQRQLAAHLDDAIIIDQLDDELILEHARDLDAAEVSE